MIRNINRWWLLTGGTAVLVLVVIASARGTAKLELLGQEQSLVLRVAPATLRNDPGPSYVVGAESDPEGTRFTTADISIDGPGDCRVYFDRRDNANFHFMDRAGETVCLGLSEAGVEQVLATGKLESVAGLRLARHGSHIGLFQQSKLVTAAFDDRLTGGNAGFRMLSSETPVTLKVEPREDIHFTDDFMITDVKSAQWRGNGNAERGDFAVKSLRHPLLSANAFCYMGAGSNIHSVAGQPWWDRYCYEVSVRGPVGGCIGLVFAYQNDKNYGLFRWSARKTAADGATVADAGKRELVRVNSGSEEVLASSPGGYIPDQWYAAQVVVSYSNFNVSVDGYPLMEASDPCLAAGAAGVWCDVPLPATLALDPKAQSFQVNSLDGLMRQHAVFDDIRINTLDGIRDDFRVAGPLAGGWLVGPGDWTVTPDQGSGGAGALQVLPQAGATKALIGDRRWAQYEVEADVQPGSGGAGLVFLHRDENSYFTATVAQGQLKLACVAEGRATVVDSAKLNESTGPTVHLKASIRHGHVRVTANNAASVETFVGEVLLKGRAGFVAVAGSRGAPCVFKHFNLAFLPEREPMVTTNAIFEDELTMGTWANQTGEWYAPSNQLLVDGKPATLLWHCCQFPGDVELAVEPREIQDKDPKFELALSVAKDGQGKNNGYVFRYRCGENNKGGSRMSTIQLLRQGELKVERTLSDDPRLLSSMALRRCGKYLVGLLDGRPVIQFRDEQPLSGNKVAYYTQGVVLRSEATKITSENFRNDLFSRAPTPWRTAGNVIAEVTNRWQCDPRWSFFSLKNDMLKAGKAAAFWSKYLYPGDVTMEFFVGTKMEGERGPPYTYTRDINATICSDGSDLGKGYCFQWGGDNNNVSRILRDGVEVKRSGEHIPTDMNYHRVWFNYRIEKQGGHLSFRVLDSSGRTHCKLEYDDPQPLQGDHVAIWTYNNAIMLSRVRISGDGGNVAENPDWRPEALKTPYDNAK